MATAADFVFTAWRLKTGSAINAAQAACHCKVRSRGGKLQTALPGDYVILDPDGTMRVVPEADFEAEFEAVSTPAAPTSLVSSAQETDSITLTWTDGASSQQVEIFRDNVLIATVNAGVETYEDDDAALTPNTAYVYKIRSIINEARSAFTANLTGYTDPSAPTNCAVEITGATTATVTWDDVPGAQGVGLTYQVDVEGTPSGTPVAAGVGTKAITGLTTATEYDFTVRAIGGTSTQSSAASNTATDTTE